MKVAIMTPREIADLARFERVVADNEAAAIRWGRAMWEICRDRPEGPLHRATHRSRAAYLAERWPNVARSTASRLIMHEDVKEDLSHGWDIPQPLTQSQTMPMSELDGDGRREAWRNAVAANGGRQPTGDAVRQAVDEVQIDRLSADGQLALVRRSEAAIIDRQDRRQSQTAKDALRKLFERFYAGLRVASRAAAKIGPRMKAALLNLAASKRESDKVMRRLLPA